MSLLCIPNNVAVVVHDAGGVAVLIPVVEQLIKLGSRLRVIVSGPSVNIWNQRTVADVELFNLNDLVSEKYLTERFNEWKLNLLISASGVYNSIEFTARLVANQNGIRVVALLDSWLNYYERFSRNNNLLLPDAVCVIDSHTEQGMYAIGMNEDSVFVTGHSGLEEMRKNSGSRSKGKSRLELGLSETDNIITFFSDPFYIGSNREYYSGPGAIMKEDGLPLYGYTSDAILVSFLSAMEKFNRASGIFWKIVVRPHPMECMDEIEKVVASFSSETIDVELNRKGTSESWISASDVCVGMMSIALLQARLEGKAAMSIEIGLEKSGESDPCLSNILGYTRAITDVGQLDGMIKSLLAGNMVDLLLMPDVELPLTGSADRVIAVVCGVQ